MPVTKGNDKELQNGIRKLVRIAKRVYPKLAYEVKIPGYEDQDALLVLYCPAKYEDKIQHALYDPWYALLNEKDIFIGKFILPPHKNKKPALS